MPEPSPRPETQPSRTDGPPRTRVVLGKYQLMDRLGQGGNGVVYRALDTSLQRTVAVKLLPRHLYGLPGVVERFQREAQAAARIHHPHVIAIFEIACDADNLFLVLEYAAGGSVEEQLIRKGRLAWPEATRILRDACRGLAAAHTAGLIHRDIKPGNILLAADGLAKLADFGLARDPTDTRPALTEPGCLVGTPLFMSPEQCRNDPLDERTDLYSLGATYYNLLTGVPPFHAQGAAVRLAHLINPIPDPRSVVPDLPEPCAAIVRSTLAKEPGQRPGSARELLAALDAVLALSVARAREPSAPVAAPASLPPPPPLPANTKTAPHVHRAWPWKRLLGAAAVAALLLGLALLGGRPNRRVADAQPGWPDSPYKGAGQIQVLAVSHDPLRPFLSWAETTSDGKSKVFLWDWRAGQVRFRHEPTGHVLSLALSPDGSLLAYGADGGSKVTVVDTATEQQKSLELDNGGLRALAFADNRTLVAGVDVWRQPQPTRGELRIFDLGADGKQSVRKSCPEPRDEGKTRPVAVKALAAAPGGTALALGLSDGRVLLWRTGDWTLCHTLEVAQVGKGTAQTARRHVYSLAFSPDGRLLAGGTAGGKSRSKHLVCLWNTGSGQLDDTLEHPDEVFAVAFSSDGQTLATASEGHIRMWDIRNRRQRGAPLSRQHALIRGLAFSRDGRTLFSGGYDKTLRCWPIGEPVAP